MTAEKKKTATKKKPAAKAKGKPVVMNKDRIEISNLSSRSFRCVLNVLQSLFETERDLLGKGADDGGTWRCDGYKLRVFMLRNINDTWTFLFVDIIDDEKENQEVEK